MFPRITKLKERYCKSKKGFTLVEVLASLFVLVIVFTGVLSAVAFSRQMVFTNNNKEKASDEAQLIADEIISVTSGCVDITAACTDVADYFAPDPSDPTAVARAEDKTGASFGYSGAATESYCQYMIEEVGFSDTDTEASTTVSGSTVSAIETKQQGFKITVRVYYSRINGGGGYECVEITAFSPAVNIS